MSATTYGRKVGVGIGAVVLLLLLLYVFPVGILIGFTVLLGFVMLGEVGFIRYQDSSKVAIKGFGQIVVILVGVIGMLLVLQQGATEFLLLGCISMITDIAAQIAGRRWGEPGTFFPKISPGKSWQGAFVGWLAGTTISMGICVAVLLGAPVFVGVPFTLVLVVLLLAPILAIAGDLYSSLLKREAGIKDFASYIPGTGGVLDRFDSWLPVFALALLLV